MDYYDAVLGLIPLSVGGISVVLLWVGITMSLAVSTGALIGAGLMGHAMFVRTPGRRSVDADAPLDSGHAAQSKTGEYVTVD